MDNQDYEKLLKKAENVLSKIKYEPTEAPDSRSGCYTGGEGNNNQDTIITSAVQKGFFKTKEEVIEMLLERAMKNNAECHYGCNIIMW